MGMSGARSSIVLYEQSGESFEKIVRENNQFYLRAGTRKLRQHRGKFPEEGFITNRQNGVLRSGQACASRMVGKQGGKKNRKKVGGTTSDTSWLMRCRRPRLLAGCRSAPKGEISVRRKKVQLGEQRLKS